MSLQLLDDPFVEADRDSDEDHEDDEIYVCGIGQDGQHVALWRKHAGKSADQEGD